MPAAFPSVTTTNNGDAAAALQSAAAANGLNVNALNGMAQVQLALANLLRGLYLAAVPTVESLTSTGFIKSSSPTAGVGYATGAGGVIAQQSNKSTTVVLSTMSGQITMNAANLVAGTIVTFTVTNTAIVATDVVVAVHGSAETSGAYQVWAHTVAAGSYKISVQNVSGGDLAEAIVLNVAVIRAVAA